MDKYNEEETLDGVIWTKYKIIVPTERDRKELMDAFEHIHDSDINNDFVVINQLMHEYMTPERSGNPKSINNIVVNKDLYDKI